MIELYVSSLITFFVVIDPPGCAPIYAGLTKGVSAAHRRSMAVRSVLVAAVRYRDGETAEGQSEDRTLAWRWHVAPDGARSFDVWLWDGRRMRAVMADRIAAAR